MGLHKGGGNCLKYPKRGWNRKRGGETDFKKERGGRQDGSSGGCLKKVGAGTPCCDYNVINVIIM